MPDLFAFLHAHGIAFERCDHPAAFTVADVERVVTLPGARTKNLFLRDKKGTRQALVVVRADKPVDLKMLAERTGFDRPSFGSPDRLKRFLGIEPGAVSLLALMHDVTHGVEVFIDHDLWEASTIQCHPLVNTTTLALTHDGIVRFLRATGHRYVVMDFPPGT